MNTIKKYVYKSLSDFSEVNQFMIENYSIDWKNGVPAPFYEYAQVLDWTDFSQTHRNALWKDKGKIVAFCFYEDKIGKAFFNLNPDYEFLIPEMINHAEERLFDDNGKLELVILSTQTAIIKEAEKLGYKKVYEWAESVYDFKKAPLNISLPSGYSFEEADNLDMKRMIDATWKGFDHDDEPENSAERGYHLMAAPNANPELYVAVKNEEGDYVCCAGMWFVPQNNLAYLEPLATVPEYRGKGLAAAALSELYRRTSLKGATHMTGGDNQFYFKIGFEEVCKFTIWNKEV